MDLRAKIVRIRAYLRGVAWFTLFETAIGTCGVAWGERGLTAVEFPRSDPEKTRARLARHATETGDVPPDVRRAIDRVVALLAGESTDLAWVEVDFGEMPDFHRRVYELIRRIPPGATLTYGEIARRLGAPGGAQAVGQAMGRNPVPIVVPCHRVLGASSDGGFSAPGGVETKRRMLAIEGATLFA
jgi:methylated-DNA-[protein]-cysteine S-methyltransferase